MRNWEDIRYVIAIYQTGTVSAAARKLGVDQTTVSRRLKSIEAALGQKLFNRGGLEMVATELCNELVADGIKMEGAYLNLAERVATYRSEHRNVVRISAMPWIVNHLLVPRIGAFLDDNPDIAIDTVSSVRDRNRTRGEVDLSLRFEILPGSRDVCRPIAKITYSIYGKEGLVPDALPWIGFGSDMLEMAPARWISRHVENVGLWVNDAGAMMHAIESGAGKGLLPDYLAAQSARLERLSAGEKPDLTRILRLLINPDLARLGHIRAVVNWLAGVMQETGMGAGRRS